MDDNNFNNQYNQNNQFNNQPVYNGENTPPSHIRKKFFSNAFIQNEEPDTGAYVPENTGHSVKNKFFNFGNKNDKEEVEVNTYNEVKPEEAKEVLEVEEPQVIEELDLGPAQGETIETLDAEPSLTEELEILDDIDKQAEVESLDVLDAVPEPPSSTHNEIPVAEMAPVPEPTPVESAIQVPKLDQGLYSSYNQNNGNQQQVGVLKPQELEQNSSFNFGYNTQVVTPSAAVPPGVIAPSIITGVAAGAPTIENSAVFQAANQTAGPSNVTPANQRVDTTPVEQWMTSQPLSSGNIENSTQPETKVMSANERERLEKERLNPTKPVPEEVTKPPVTVNIRPELLVKEYIGDDYTSITMAPLNFGCLLFGAAYFAYRKLYFWALLNMVIAGAILFFVPINYNYLALLGFHVLMALAVNRIYVLHVKIIAKIEAKGNAKKKNPKTQEELEQNMRLRGRVSIISALLTICLFVAGIITIAVYILPNNDVSKLINKAFGGNPFKVLEFKYDGKIVLDDSYNVHDLINVTIPAEFEGNDGNIVEFVYKANPEDEKNFCSIRIGTVKDFDNGNSYIVKMAAFNKEEDKVKKSPINGIEWTNYYTEDDDYNLYYKGSTIKEKALFFEYKASLKDPDEVCDKFYIDIMESISLKEE